MIRIRDADVLCLRYGSPACFRTAWSLQAAQPVEPGVAPKMLVAMAEHRHLRRIGHGLCRDSRVPENRWTPFMTATAWPYGVVGLLARDRVESVRAVGREPRRHSYRRLSYLSSAPLSPATRRGPFIAKAWRSTSARPSRGFPPRPSPSPSATVRWPTSDQHSSARHWTMPASSDYFTSKFRSISDQFGAGCTVIDLNRSQSK